MRNNKKVSEAENKYFEILWYIRHTLGKDRWLEKYQNSEKQELRDIAKRAVENANRIEINYAEDPEFIMIKEGLSKDYNFIYNQNWEDGYYRGVIDGKLSALRWVLGEEWDFLDT